MVPGTAGNTSHTNTILTTAEELRLATLALDEISRLFALAALLVRATPAPSGFGSYSDSTIQGKTSYIKGYPQCGGSGSGDPNDEPGGSASSSNVFRTRTLYGDSQAAPIGQTIEDGRLSFVSMSASPGQSGSATYFNSNGVKVWGPFTAGTFCFQNCSYSHPLRVTRITSSSYTWILGFMGL